MHWRACGWRRRCLCITWGRCSVDSLLLPARYRTSYGLTAEASTREISGGNSWGSDFDIFIVVVRI